MHALTILHRCLGPLLTGIHARRLATLLEAVAATVCGPRLTLTDIGRRFGGEASLRNRIKRSDRLLGNRHLQGQARTIYAALARKLLSGVLEPLIVIDWSDLKADQSLHLLRASLPVGGRSLTLYEEVHPQGKLGNRQVQHRFLQRLAQLLPASAEPIIVADSGFKVPFFREVERLGWRWVGRVRGRDYVKLKRWRSCTAPVRGGDHDPDLPRHRGVGAQQPAARALRAGAPAQAGTPGQDRCRQAGALEEEPAGRAQCPRALAAGGLDALCRLAGEAAGAGVPSADADRAQLPGHEERALRRGA